MLENMKIESHIIARSRVVSPLLVKIHPLYMQQRSDELLLE